MENLKALCDKYELEVVASFQDTDISDLNRFKESCKDVDFIIVNGEGTFHDDQPVAQNLMKAICMAKKKFHKKVYLINATWQRNVKLNRDLECFDKIFVRDSLSRAELAKEGIAAEVVPDLSMYNSEKSRVKRADKSSVIYIDSVYRELSKKIALKALLRRKQFYIMGAGNIGKILTRLLKITANPIRTLDSEDIFAENNLIVSGRFHSICLALLHKTPFRCFSSNTYKIEGMLEDVGLDVNKFVISSKELWNIQFMEFTDLEKNMIDKYVTSVNYKIDKMMISIIEDTTQSKSIKNIIC